MKFSVTTLGCKVNQFESQSIEGILVSRGHIMTETGRECDICVVNTCAVTAESVRKSKQMIRRLKKLAPNALIAVCGCCSQLELEIIKKLGADLIGGTGDRQGFAIEMERLFDRKQNECLVFSDDPFERTFFEELPPGPGRGRTRAMLKIQDGCDNYCAYCVVPYARGNSRSLPIARVAEHSRRLSEEGYREIVTTGIEISSYGKDLPGVPVLFDAPHPHGTPMLFDAPHPLETPVFADTIPSLPDALAAISAAAPNTRIRLGSLDPSAINEGFCIKLSGIPNLCNHFHISLQSGCDETLSRMGRKYDTNDVRGAMALLRAIFPGCAITADLIAGFPGETDGEFACTMDFIKESAFSDMHIFPFSSRPGTPAAEMPNQIDKSVKRERARLAADLAAEMAQSFKLSQIGKTVGVLFERESNGIWLGHSENYLEIAVEKALCGLNAIERNSILPVKITAVEDGRVVGAVVCPEDTIQT